MKYFFLFLMIQFTTGTFAQTPEQAKADTVLKQLEQKINSLKRINYHYKREMQYFADNYHNLTEGDIYIEFNPAQPIGIRFTATRQNRYSVYNGQAVFTIDQSEMTIDSSAGSTAKSMESNSDLSHSVVTLKNILPRIIGNHAIERSAKDTILHNTTYTCVYFEGPETFVSGLGKLETYTAAGLRRPYYIIIDKVSGLPFKFDTKFIRQGDDRDYISVTFTSFNANPPQTSEDTWRYETYTKLYKRRASIKKIPVIKPGEAVQDFVLPAYTTGSVDSISLKQYAGKVILLDFWFKSCGPCMEAMPKYKALQSRLAASGFRLLTVNVEDGVDDIKFFYNKHKPNYPMLFNGAKVFAGLGLTGCPSSVLIDRHGKVVSVFMGYNEEKINAAIEAILRQ